MATESFGLKATGFCIEPLFVHGVPTSLDTIIHGIDNQLAENSRQLEDCIKEIMEMSNQLSGTGKLHDDPTEAVDHVTENLLLEKMTCYDLDTENIVQMLRSVIKFIEANPGSEETVLHDLLTLCSTQGLVFPACASSIDVVGQSTLSLNTAIDQSEQAVESLWNDVCLRLHRYFIGRLMKLHAGQPDEAISAVPDERLRCVQSLCCIFPAQSVLMKYRSVRQHQLQSYAAVKNSSKRDFAGLVETFVKTSKEVVAIVRSDVDLFNAGVFQDDVDFSRGIADVYFDALVDQAIAVLDVLSGELPSVGKKKDDKGFSKSPSDTGFLGRHLRSGLRRQQSHSLESLVARGEEQQQFTDISLFPEKALSSLVCFVECLVNIERQLESMNPTATWQLAGSASSTKNVERKLKSALKSACNSTNSEDAESFRDRGAPPARTCFTEETSKFDGNATVSDVRPVVKEKSSVSKPQFEWRGIFQGICPDLAVCLQSHFNSFVERTSKEEKVLFQKTTTVQKYRLPKELVDGNRDLPKSISTATWGIFNEIDRLLPLAMCGTDHGCQSVVSTTFLYIIIHSIQTMNAWFAKLCEEPPDKVPVSCLYVGLSSLLFIQHRLCFYERILILDDEPSRQSLVLVHQSLTRTIDGYVRTIEQFHKDVLLHSVLHDAQSHGWNDSKEFFENERCSFDIQMWNFHMQRLSADLWSVCPASQSQSIYRRILRETLNLFAWRYARIQPSRRRLKQFVADVSAILLCTSELLLFACDSLAQFTEPSDEPEDLAAIHDSCNLLMATLAVLGSPIEVVYKIFRKGFDKRLSSHSEDKSVHGYRSQWLSYLRPLLLPPGGFQTSMDSMQTTTAVYLHLTLTSRQPTISSHHILEALLMKDYALTIVLLTQLDESLAKNEETNLTKDVHAAAAQEIAVAFVDVFVKCGKFPDGLTRILLPLIERSNSWNLFDTSIVIGKTESIPVWLSALIKQLKVFTDRVIEPGIRLLLNKMNSPQSTASPLSAYLHEQLPCGCQPLKKPVDTSDSNAKDLVAESMYSVITQLVSDIHAVPISILIFFQAAQETLSQKGIISPFKTLGIKILATCLRLALTDLDEICQKIGRDQLDLKLKDKLNMLAECIYHVLTSPAYDKTSGTPRIAGLFMKANKNWISEQIEALTEYMNNDMFEPLNRHPLNGVSPVYAEQLLVVQCSSILASKTGKRSLVILQNFIMNNRFWVFRRFDCPVGLCKDETRTSSEVAKTMTLDLNEHDSSISRDFNPLLNYAKLGDGPFDHSLIMDYTYDWTALLQCDLGLSLVTFRSLLLHRPDVRDNLDLEDCPKRMVEILRKKYHKEISS